MKYKLCVFDLDGTILDTLPDLHNACNLTLAEFGLPPITAEQARAFVGNGVTLLIERASFGDGRKEQLIKRFREIYNEHYSDYTKPYDGIREVIEECKARGATVGVLTNKPEGVAVKLCEKHFNGVFDFVTGDREGVIRKPDPTELLSIMRRYDADKSETLFVGDSEVDIETAERAGVDGVFMTYGFRGREKLKAFRQNAPLADKAEDLPKYLK